MNKKMIIIPIVIIFGIIFVSFTTDSPKKGENSVVFHVTLADPSLYGDDGVYTEKINVSEGLYKFRFVPNGSSPEILSIMLKGEKFDFHGNFVLENTLHETGISQYYTWNYEGEKEILVTIDQEILVTIDPNGNTMGSVSVDIIEN
ncbi:hypothetical protein [Nitrosopumilus sp.]|uniref:hypothetical protein n=1 Tax=Nitrosopumilus sp. TaxID=2024843 RepID=UPI003B5A355E